MRNQIVKAIGGMLAILTLAVLTQVCVSAQTRSSATPQKTDSNRDQGLAGSWDVTTMIRDCESGTIFVSFPAMMTYHQGGTMQEAANDAAPLLRTAGQGVWELQTGHTYTRAFHFFRYNADGSFAGLGKITGLITVGEGSNTYTGTTYFDFTDPNGNSVASGCATETATRFR
jgi:hypothetical protein